MRIISCAYLCISKSTSRNFVSPTPLDHVEPRLKNLFTSKCITASASYRNKKIFSHPVTISPVQAPQVHSRLPLGLVASTPIFLRTMAYSKSRTPRDLNCSPNREQLPGPYFHMVHQAFYGPFTTSSRIDSMDLRS